MFNAGELEATLTLGRTPFQAGLRQAIKDGEDFEGRRFEARAGLEDKPFKRKVGGLYSDMRKMARQRAKPKVDVNVTGGAALVKVRKQIATLPDRKDIEVRVGVKRALSAFGSVLRAATSMKTTAVASLVAIAPAAVMASAAVGGVGVAFLGILAPLGLLGLAMRNAFKKGGPEVKEFKAELKGLKKDFADAMGPGVREAFKGLTSMFKDLRTVLPGLKEGFTGLGKAVHTMFEGFGKQLSSSRFQDFFEMLTRSATKAVPLLGRSLRNLLDIFRNIATAAMPLLLKGLKMLADWLGKVASKTNDHDKLRAVFEKGAAALGKFWKIAKNLGSILASIFKAGSSGSGDFLASIERATRGLAKFFASQDGQKTLKDALASMAVFIEEIARAVPPVIRAFGKLLDIATPIYKVMTAIVKVLGKIPGVGTTIATLGLGFLAWHGPIGATKMLLTGLLGTMGKVIKRAGEKVLFRVGASAAGEGVAGAAGGAAGQRAAMAKAGTAAGTAGGAAGGGFLARFMTRLKGLPGLLVKLFKGLGPKILPALATVGAAMSGVFAKALPKIGAVFSRLGPLLRTVLVRVLPRALMAIGGLFVTAAGGWVVILVTTIATLIWMLLPKKAKAAIWRALKGAGKWVWDAIKKGGGLDRAGLWIAKKIGDGVKAGAKFVVKNATELAGKAVGAIKKAAGKFLAVGKAVILAVAKGVTGTAKKVLAAVKAMAAKALKTVKGFAGKFLAAGKELIGKVAGGIKAVAGKVAELAKAAVKKGVKAVTDLGGAFLKAGKALIMKIVEGIKSAAGAVKDAVSDAIGGARDMLPFSEPKNRSSPLYGLGKSGEATLANFGKGIAAGRNPLQARMVGALRGAAVAARDAARVELGRMDRQDARRAGPAPSRAQREGEAVGRINAARNAVDDRGFLLNNPPPGVARIASRDERDAIADREELHRGFRREDLEAQANVNITALLPSDPKVLRQVQRGVARGMRHGRRRRPKTKRKA